MQTGFSLCTFLSGKKYTGKSLFWPCTDPVRDCSAIVQPSLLVLWLAYLNGSTFEKTSLQISPFPLFFEKINSKFQHSFQFYQFLGLDKFSKIIMCRKILMRLQNIHATHCDISRGLCSIMFRKRVKISLLKMRQKNRNFEKKRDQNSNLHQKSLLTWRIPLSLPWIIYFPYLGKNLGH